VYHPPGARNEVLLVGIQEREGESVLDAGEAERIGIVNAVAGKRDWLETALKLAERVASRPPIAARLAKQAVLAAEESALSAGLEWERRLYELSMATEDRIEVVGRAAGSPKRARKSSWR
jgi:enoyl-CoA hydratase/carnithine racemase